MQQAEKGKSTALFCCACDVRSGGKFRELATAPVPETSERAKAKRGETDQSAFLSEAQKMSRVDLLVERVNCWIVARWETLLVQEDAVCHCGRISCGVEMELEEARKLQTKTSGINMPSVARMPRIPCGDWSWFGEVKQHF